MLYISISLLHIENSIDKNVVYMHTYIVHLTDYISSSVDTDGDDFHKDFVKTFTNQCNS